MIQALPVLRLLKAHDRTHQIYWWISSDLADLLRPDPDLSGLFLFHRRRWAWPRHWNELIQSVREMRAHQFDQVIDLQGLARSSLISWLVHGRVTIGVEDWREGAPAFYDLSIPRPGENAHALDWYLRVVHALGIPVHSNYAWLPPRPETQEALHKKWPCAQGKWVVIHPGARWLNKRWPAENFAQVVRALAQDQPDLHFAVMGSANERELAAPILHAAPNRCLDLTGNTTLSEMIEWIRLSTLVISNDTGPMHVAAALRTPLISLFGPTDPRRTGPYGDADNTLRIPLPCSPCLKPSCHWTPPLECLRGIPWKTVYARAHRLLDL